MKDVIAWVGIVAFAMLMAQMFAEAETEELAVKKTKLINKTNKVRSCQFSNLYQYSCPVERSI
ncbi:MAG: hypothetical protein ACXWTU_00470 [Methylotenera sp.]